MNEQDIINLLNEEISGAEKIQEDLSSKRQDYYKRFRSEPYGNEREGWSQSIVPVIWNIIESSLASFTEVFRGDFFTVKSTDDQRGEKFKKLIRYQMFRKQDGYKKIYDFLFNALLYHYSVFKVFYKEDVDIINKKFDVLTPEQMQMLVQQPNAQVSKYTEAVGDDGQIRFENVKVVVKKVLYSGPHFEVVPPWEFYYSKDCKITDWGAIEGKLVFHRVHKSLDDVRRKEKAGVYKAGSFAAVREKARLNAPKGEEEIIVKYSSDDLAEPPEVTSEANELVKEIVVDECYFRYDIDGDGLLEHCVAHKCDDVILMLEENPYGRPCFRVGALNPEPHKVTGIPLSDVLENDQRVMTNLLRLIQDSAAQSCYRNPVTNDHQMFLQLIDRKPFAVIKGDPTRLGEVAMSDPSQMVIKAYELLKAEVEEKSGVTRYNQGLDANSLNKTATGIATISAASTRKQRMNAFLFGNGAVMGVLRDFVFINQKWPNQDPVKLLGEDIEIRTEDLYGEYDIEIDVGVGPAEKQQMANQLDLFVQFATQAGIPMGITQPIHILRAQKKKYNLLDIRVDDLMVTEEQFRQAEEAKKQQPPQEDWKEFVQMDKLYPMLTRQEQMQILQRLGIQPDPQGQVAGIPKANEILEIQSRQAENQQKAQMEAAKFKMDMAGKAMDLQANTAMKKMDMAGKMLDIKGKQIKRSQDGK